MDRRAKCERGAGTLGCLLLVLLVAGGIYAGLQLYLPGIRNTSFGERLTDTYPFFARQTPDYIRSRVVQVAADFDITLTKDQVKVRIDGDRLTIDIDYDKVVDLKVWQKKLSFQIHRFGPY